MGFHSEFAEILKEKMGDTPLSTPISPLEPSVKNSFLHETFITFKTRKLRVPQSLSSKYIKMNLEKPNLEPQAKVSTSSPTIDEKKELIFSMISLNKEKIIALKEFMRMGAQLNTEELSARSIKKEYRRLIKIYHPDHSQMKDTSLILEKIIQLYRKITL